MQKISLSNAIHLIVRHPSFQLLFIILALYLLPACSVDVTKIPAAGSGVISGMVSKGPMAGATVKVYALNSDGTTGEVLGTTITDADGNFTVNIGSYTGNVLVVSSGGQYTDEATGVTKDNPGLRTALDNVKESNQVAVTALTEIAARRAEGSGGLITGNISEANAFVTDMIGDIDIVSTLPADVLDPSSSSATEDEKKYGLILAGLSQMVADGTAPTIADAMTNISNDIADGTLDQTGNDLVTAVDTFVASPDNSTGTTGTVVNLTPTANAGADQNVATGSLVTLVGSRSSDANNDTITYSWTFTSVPTGSNTSLSNSAVVNPTFTADMDGAYVLSLSVNDGTINSTVDSITVTAATANSAPVANAAANQNVATGDLVTLDGSGSSDADSDTITYAWSFTSKPSGSSASLSNAEAVNPSFTADLDGAYVLSLSVNDGTISSTIDTITVTAATANSVPVANAGVGQNVATGSLVTLDGSGSSDADSDTITYAWAFTSTPSGSSASLSNASAVNPTFTADLDGAYVLSLSVNDGTINSTIDTITVAAATANSAPVANAGIDQNVATGDLVTLDGSGSNDADSDTLTYAWSFTSRPSGSSAALSNAEAVNPSFTADMDGAYVLSLSVNDGTISSTIDTITVTAATANSVPVANAGVGQNVATGSLVTLDGSGSSDADNDTLTYAWSFTSKPSGSSATLPDASAANPTFTADMDGAYVLSLSVNDSAIGSTADTITVTAATANSAPVANAGADQSVATGELVTLDGSGSSDADSDTLTYAWSFTSKPSGSSSSLSNAAAVNPTFTPDLDGAYVLSLSVNDGTINSTIDTITVTAATAIYVPSVTWEKSFRTVGTVGRSVKQTDDGGFIATGSAYSGTDGDFYLVKTDQDGNMQWEHLYDSDPNAVNSDFGYSVEQTSDGGFILAGDAALPGTNFRTLWLVKTDANGELEWQKRLDTTVWNQAREIRAVSTGGFIIVGNTGSGGCWLVRIDQAGNILWQNTYPSSGGGGEDVYETDDGGFILVTYYGSFIKTDSNGSVLWRTDTYSQRYRLHSVKPTLDGGYIAAGNTYFYDETGSFSHYNLYVKKVDSAGNTLWENFFGGESQVFSFTSVESTPDGGYIVAGSTRYGSVNSALILKLNMWGNMVWEKSIGEYLFIEEAQTTKEGGVVVVGQKYHNGQSLWLSRLD